MKEDNNIIDFGEKLSKKDENVLRDAINDDVNNIDIPENLPKLWTNIEKKINRKNRIKKTLKAGRYVAACFAAFMVISFTTPYCHQESDASIISMLRQFVGNFNGQKSIDYTNIDIVGLENLEDENLKNQLISIAKKYNVKINLPSYLPEGFKLCKITPEVLDDKIFELETIYCNDKNTIKLNQVFLDKDIEFSKNVGISNNLVNLETTINSNFQSTLFTENDTNILYLIINSKNSYYELEAQISKYELIEVGNSIIQ